MWVEGLNSERVEGSKRMYVCRLNVCGGGSRFREGRGFGKKECV